MKKPWIAVSGARFAKIGFCYRSEARNRAELLFPNGCCLRALDYSTYSVFCRWAESFHEDKEQAKQLGKQLGLPEGACPEERVFVYNNILRKYILQEETKNDKR